MAIPYLLKINGQDINKIASYKVERNKLWKDANRNMRGELKTTKIGVFPKILLKINPTTEDEYSDLIALLDLDSFNVAWYDAGSKGIKTGVYYASDFGANIMSLHKGGMHEAFEVNLIPYTRLS